MRFWDSSAIVPLLLTEEASGAAAALLSGDPELVVWWGTRVECASALARVRREEVLTVGDEERALALLRRLREAWLEVLPSEELAERAMRLLRIHPLRAADACQLAAAGQWAGDAAGRELVTFDERLALAARLEGFRIRGADSVA